MTAVAEEQVEKLYGFAIHPIAAKFPLMQGDDFEELVDSIRTDGLYESIKLSPKGVVVDGRNRMRACSKAGVEPRYEKLDDSIDLAAYIAAMNLKRRHLNTGQRALIAAEIADMTKGRPTEDGGTVSLDEAASMMDVSRRSASRARKVEEEAEPEVTEAVRSGDMSLAEAEEAAKGSKEEQKAAAEAAKSNSKPRRSRTPLASEFKRDKWQGKMEKALSKLVAGAPEDQRDWCRRQVREHFGGPGRKEMPSGGSEEDADLFEAVDIVQRVDAILKHVPATERKTMRAEVGTLLMGDKPSRYWPPMDELSVHEALQRVTAEYTERVKQLKDIVGASPAEVKTLRGLAGNLRKLVKDSADE